MKCRLVGCHSRWRTSRSPPARQSPASDDDEIQLTVDNAVDLGRPQPLKRRTSKAIRTGLGLIVQGRLINAAIDFCGKPQRLGQFDAVWGALPESIKGSLLALVNAAVAPEEGSAAT